MDMEKLASLFEAVKVLPLRSSDFVIFRTPVSLSLDQMAEIHAVLESKLEHSRILILDQGADIEVLRREREPEAAAPVRSPSPCSCTARSAATRSRSRRRRPRRARRPGRSRDRPRARQGPVRAREVPRRPAGKLLRNVLRGALRAGAGVILPVARSNIHNVSGRLAQVAEDRLGVIVGDKAIGRLYTRDPSRTWSSTARRRTVITAKNRKAPLGRRALLPVGAAPGRAAEALHAAGGRHAGAGGARRGGRIHEAKRATKAGLDTADITVEGDDA
jgi:hypothetical protein